MPAAAPPARRFAILNDFEAVGYGIPVLEDADIVPVNMAATEAGVRLGLSCPALQSGWGCGLGCRQHDLRVQQPA